MGFVSITLLNAQIVTLNDNKKTTYYSKKFKLISVDSRPTLIRMIAKDTAVLDISVKKSNRSEVMSVEVRGCPLVDSPFNPDSIDVPISAVLQMLKISNEEDLRIYDSYVVPLEPIHLVDDGERNARKK